MSDKLRTVVCLLRNDLRVHDNEALLWAHRNGDFIVPLYCFDPEHFKGTWHFNFPKTGPHRGKFILDSVQDLKKNLQGHNSNLVVEFAKPLDSLKRIVKYCSESSSPVLNVVYQQEVTYEELKVEKEIKDFCKSQNIKVTEIWGSSMYHSTDLPFKNMNAIPDTYTQFRKEVEARSKVRPVLAIPKQLKPFPSGLPLGSMPDLASLGVKQPGQLDSRTAFPFPAGGETSGLDRLHNYLWGSHAVARYKETRNGMVGEDYSTKFSPWLALGCISPRMIFSQIKKYEQEEVANQSTYWVIFELIWRDYFKFVCQKYGDRVFYLSGILNKHLPWSQDMDQFRAWAEGRTGVPFVDANMRELKETGWMSNRGRQNVASFLIKDLGLDWRLGAEWFESQLLDHDVCSNYGNWNYAAGIGNDPRENRKFNMIKQGMDYDGEGEFVRLWVEELRGIKGSKAHVPWTLTDGELEKAGVELGTTYPKPLVLAPEWSRHAGGKQNSQNGSHRGQSGPSKGQKGINFYFKTEPKTGQSDGNQRSNNSSSAGGGNRGRGSKAPLRGGRVQ
eukprot:GFUD01019735.1.p1 GENE.GFUD01019735.1~~GFUD01019735.1.p1  ORF type:complete len:558 (+),score=144.72 GFUD01019735.1:51-1724(+)